jgi:hypothetical protein
MQREHAHGCSLLLSQLTFLIACYSQVLAIKSLKNYSLLFEIKLYPSCTALAGGEYLEVRALVSLQLEIYRLEKSYKYNKKTLNARRIFNLYKSETMLYIMTL